MSRALIFVILISIVSISIAACGRASTTPVGYINPENSLEEALVRSAMGHRSKEEGLVSALVRSRVYFRIPKESLMDDGSIRDPSKVTYMTLSVNGREAMALYTSERRLTQRFGSVPYMYMDGIEAMKLADGLPVAVNSGLSPSAFIKAEDVQKIVKKKLIEKAI